MAAAVLGTREMTFIKEGTSAAVPNDKLDKLMYYLKCICSLLGPNGKNIIPQKYQNFKNYSQIKTLAEKKILLYMCALLEPKVIENKCIFESEAIASENEFFELKQVSNIIAVSESVVINGKVTEVNKIMVYKKAWLDKIFYIPFVVLNDECKDEELRPAKSTTCTIV